MLCLAVKYTFVPGAEEQAAAYFRKLIPASRQEPGCRMYVVHRGKDDPSQFFIYEQYDDEAALDAHRASSHFQQYGKNGIQTIAASREPALYVPLAE
ncbi:MAG: antibiotic biosynthesis monooxygenase [Candidatus Eremiobacteraeota bacterium]|nr:antibiotic biosynthesis monooxygenase [Candidatus Eremiobacteraeota bacterium]